MTMEPQIGEIFEDRMASSRRDRANESLQSLHDALSRRPVTVIDLPAEQSPRKGHQRASSWSERGAAGTHDYSYRSAAQRLREMLQQTDRQPPHNLPPSGVHFSPPRWSELPTDQRPDAQTRDQLRGNAGRVGEMPSAEELYAIVQQQGAYITQLELENKYCKEELASVRTKLGELSSDNQRLLAELKRAIVHDVIQGGNEETEKALMSDVKFQNVRESPEFITRSIMLSKWQKETDRISQLHEAKNARLELQLQQTRADVTNLERENERLKSSLRMSDSVSVHRHQTSLLCAVCAKNDAVVPSQHGALAAAVDRLTSERDGLVESLTALKVKLDLMQHREAEAYDQVKSSIILVEEAQLEKTEALVHREQIGDELEKLRTRFEEHISDTQTKLNIERDLIRREFQKEIDDANDRLKDLNEAFTTAQHKLERTQREKATLQSEFDQMKSQLHLYDSEYGQATNSMKYQMAKATIDKNLAVQAMHKLRTDLQKMEHDHDQDRLKHKTEVDDLKRRVNNAERDLMESKEECIYLTSTLQALERDIHFAKISKDSLERGRSDDMKVMAVRAQQREEQLNSCLQQIQTKYEQVNMELEEMVSKQNVLVHKLRDECSNLATKLEQVTSKRKKDSKAMKSHIAELAHRLLKSKERIKEMEKQHIEHGQLHEKMRSQLKSMDQNAQANAQQILDLLSIKADLLKDRDLLAKDVDYLRHQIGIHNESDLDKLMISQKRAVDDIVR